MNIPGVRSKRVSATSRAYFQLLFLCTSFWGWSRRSSEVPGLDKISCTEQASGCWFADGYRPCHPLGLGMNVAWLDEKGSADRAGVRPGPQSHSRCCLAYAREQKDFGVP